MKKIGQLVGLVLTAAVSTAANAGFTVENLNTKQQQHEQGRPVPQADNPTKVTFSVAGVPAGVSQIGSSRGQLPAVKGFARDVSVLTALKQIVPEGWHAKKAGDIDINKTVSWRGDGRNWIEILHSLGVTNGFSAQVNWDSHELTISPVGGASAQSAIKVREGKEAKAEVAGPKSWVLKTDLTLKENIEAWAKESGWTVSWAAVDYPVSVQVTLSGELDEENGPIHSLSEAYRQSEQPLVFSFKTQNRVIRVENATYKPLPQKDELATHGSTRVFQ